MITNFLIGIQVFHTSQGQTSFIKNQGLSPVKKNFGGFRGIYPPRREGSPQQRAGVGRDFSLFVYYQTLLREKP